jgi:hypothetical protein
MRPLLFCGLALAMVVQPSFADRAAYSGARDIVAHGATIMVRHHHDWSRIPTKDGAWHLRYSAATPFGVDEETSNLEFYSSQGALVARVPSPPLTYLEISADGRYVIGLSEIKHLNPTQLVVFSPKGELLLRRRISAHVYCFDVAGYQDLKRKHREAFSELDRYSQLSHDSYGWRESDSVYLDIRGGIGEPYWTALWHDLFPAMCDSPLSPNFDESVTNWIHWYHDTDPRPQVVERHGRPFEVRLRDPKGIEFAVKFELTPLEAQVAGRAVQ